MAGPVTISWYQERYRQLAAMPLEDLKTAEFATATERGIQQRILTECAEEPS